MAGHLEALEVRADGPTGRVGAGIARLDDQCGGDMRQRFRALNERVAGLAAWDRWSGREGGGMRPRPGADAPRFFQGRVVAVCRLWQSVQRSGMALPRAASSLWQS
jgi:hypothetical protein